MQSQQIIDLIREFCLENANEANVKKYCNYFKAGLYNGYGLTQVQINLKAKELSKMQGISLKNVLEAAPGLLNSKKYEEISCVLQLIGLLHKEFTKDTFEKISHFYTDSIENWAHADTLGMQVLPLFLSKNLVKVEDFENWLKAPNKYQRRSVPVTLIKILKTPVDYGSLFSFTECLMTDPEREVHQGMGWFLREAWKRKQSETETFLLKWKNVAPRLIIQYATEKMTAEEKMRFRKTKS